MNKPLLSSADKSAMVAQLAEEYGSTLSNERFELEARREGEAVIAQLVLASNDRTFVYTMEVAMMRGNYKGMDEPTALGYCLDFLSWYVAEFFKSQREMLLPLDWQPHRFDDVEVSARGDVRNAFLDDAADAWLRGERPDVASEWKALKG